MTNLAHLNDQLQAMVSDIRSGIDALDRTGRYGEHVVVTVTLSDGSERQYERYAPYGCNALASHLMMFHQKKNAQLVAKAGARSGERRQKLVAKQVTYVEVSPRSMAWSTARHVYQQSSV